MGKKRGENTHKNIVLTLKLVSLFFILRLFLFSFEFNFGGWGGFIDLSIWPTWFDFWWFWNNTIALILFVLWIWVFQIKDKSKSLVLLSLVFVLSIFWKEIFYQISPDFKFYFTDRYEDEVYKDNEFDVDKYLVYIDKYCQQEKWWIFLWRGRESWCSNKGKIGVNLWTADDAIKLLEYANNNNRIFLYERYFTSVNQIGFDEIITKYDDKTFQAYVIYMNRNHIDDVDRINLNKIDENINDENLKKLISDIKKISYDYKNNNSFDNWDNFSN